MKYTYRGGQEISKGYKSKQSVVGKHIPVNKSIKNIAVLRKAAIMEILKTENRIKKPNETEQSIAGVSDGETHTVVLGRVGKIRSGTVWREGVKGEHTGEAPERSESVSNQIRGCQETQMMKEKENGRQQPQEE